MNKALLNTETFSELGKARDQKVLLNGAAYLALFGRYTLSVVSVIEVVRGFSKKQATRQLQAFLASLSALEVPPSTRPPPNSPAASKASWNAPVAPSAGPTR